MTVWWWLLAAADQLWRAVCWPLRRIHARRLSKVAAEYDQLAAQATADGHPRTARLLRELADEQRRQAARRR